MNTLKVIAGLVVIALVGGGAWMVASHSKGGQVFGALTGPEIASPFLQWGGVYRFSTALDCNSGQYAASSTLFAIPNPTGATSTAEIPLLTTTGQATTTSLSIGTSTATTGLTAAPTSSTLLSAVSVATNTQAAFSSGQTSNLGNGQVSAGSNTSVKIVIGPGESLVGYGTSTATGAGAANYTPGIGCHGAVTWTR